MTNPFCDGLHYDCVKISVGFHSSFVTSFLAYYPHMNLLMK